MIPSQQILPLCLLLLPTFIFAQNRLPAHEKETVIERIKTLIDENYVFVDKISYVNNALDSLQKTGKYDGITDYEAFAKVLSEDLVGITQDKHFKVQYSPEFIQARRERLKRRQEATKEESQGQEEATIDWGEWYARQENFGFQKVEVLKGNIGYLKLTFWQPLAWVEPTIDAAMRFLSNTNALIIDLTENQGGYSPTDSYLGSYFFDEEPQLWMSSYNRPTEETSRDSTFQELGGERYLNKPVYILVSESTFSLAECFAYSMKHFGKATIVGQVTAGAAHAINFLDANENYGVQVPVLYNIHPVTQTDWEGTGVRPHISTSKEEALKVAHLKALDQLIESATHERIVKRYHEIKKEVSQ